MVDKPARASGIDDKGIARAQRINQDYDHVSRFARATIGLVPGIGSAFNELILNPILAEERPRGIEREVSRDLDQLRQAHKAGKVSMIDALHRVANTLTDDRLPVEQRMRYLPVSLKGISDLAVRWRKEVQQFQDTQQGTNVAMQAHVSKLEETFSALHENMGGLQERLAQITAMSSGQEQEIAQLRTEIFRHIDHLSEVANSASKDMCFSRIEAVDALQALALEFYVQEPNGRAASAPAMEKAVEAVSSAGQFVTSLGQLTGSKELVHTGVVAGAVCNIGTNLLSFAVNPVSALFNIGTAGVGLAQHFGGNSGGVAEATMRQLQQIAQFLGVIREEMHARFDIIDQKLDVLYDTALQGFSQLEGIALHSSAQLQRVAQRIDKIEREVLESRHAVMESLNQLQEFLQMQEPNETISKTAKEVFQLAEETTPQYKKFRKRVGKLHANIYCDALGQKLNFQPLCLAAAARPDCSIQLLFKTLVEESQHVLPNPILYKVATLGILILTLKQYPSNQSAKNLRIHQDDVDRLQELRGLGDTLQVGIDQMRRRVDLPGLFEVYSTTATQLSAILQESSQEKLQEVAERASQAVQATQGLHYHGREQISAFGPQAKDDFSISLEPDGSGWFALDQCKLWEDHSNTSGDYWHQRYHTTQDRARKNYKAQIRGSVKISREAYLAKRRGSQSRQAEIADINPSIAPDSFGQPAHLELPWFISPAQNQLPYLPVPDELSHYIPDQVRRACGANLGHLEFVYSLEGGQFVISLRFCPTGRTPIEFSKVSMAFEPGIFQGGEAVWWFWVTGNHPTTLEVTHWQEGGKSLKNDITYHCYAYPVVQADVPGRCDQFDITDKRTKKNPDGLARIMRLLEDRRTEVLEELGSHAIKTLDSRATKPLVKKLDGCYAQLACYLQLVHEQEAYSLESPLRRWLDGMPCLANSRTLKGFCATNSESLLYPLGGLLDAHLGLLPQILRTKSQQGTRSTLSTIIRLLGQTIAHYKPHSVQVNDWYASPAVIEVKDGALADLLHGALETWGLVRDKTDPTARIVKESLLKTARKIRERHDDLIPDDQAYLRLMLENLEGGGVLKIGSGSPMWQRVISDSKEEADKEDD